MVRISADGQHVSRIEKPNVPEIQDGGKFEFLNFAIRKNGEILEIGRIIRRIRL